MRRLLLVATGAMLVLMLAMAGAASAQTDGGGDPEPVDLIVSGDELLTFAEGFPSDYSLRVDLSALNTPVLLFAGVTVEQTPSGLEVIAWELEVRDNPSD